MAHPRTNMLPPPDSRLTLSDVATRLRVALIAVAFCRDHLGKIETDHAADLMEWLVGSREIVEGIHELLCKHGLAK